MQMKFEEFTYEWKIPGFSRLCNLIGGFNSYPFEAFNSKWRLQFDWVNDENSSDSKIDLKFSLVNITEDDEEDLYLMVMVSIKNPGGEDYSVRNLKPCHIYPERRIISLSCDLENDIFGDHDTLTVECLMVSVRNYKSYVNRCQNGFDEAATRELNERLNSAMKRQKENKPSLLSRFESGLDSDFCIHVNENTINCHSIVLKIHSPVLESLITRGENEIVLNGCNYDAVYKFFRFFYCQEEESLDLDTHASHLLILAYKFGHEYLKTVVECHIMEKLTKENYTEYLMLAEQCQSVRLLKSCEAFSTESNINLED